MTLAGHLTRWRSCCLQTLLLLLLCGCAETVDPTVLRFYVYSDVPLSEVRVTVLDSELADSGLERVLTREDAGVADANVLFSIAVARSYGSRRLSEAVLRFEGYGAGTADNPIVLNQTVRADFADRETRLVRIWLSRACVRDTPQPCRAGQSCDWLSGKCEPTESLPTEPLDAGELARWVPPTYRACGARDGGVSDVTCPVYCSPADDSDCELRGAAAECTHDGQCATGDCQCADAQCAQMRCCTPPNCALRCAADLRTDAKNCGGCDRACRYPRCASGVCSPYDVTPTATTGASADFTAVYLRRAVGPRSGVAAVGIHSDQAGARFRLFVADDDQGEPGAILASAEVTVPPSLNRDAGVAQATEYVFPQPVVPSEGGFWFGAGAIGSATVRVATPDAPVDERLATQVPALGERFAQGSLIRPDAGLPQTPSLYAVYYP